MQKISDDLLIKTLEQHNGNVTHTAEVLGLPRRTVGKWKKRLEEERKKEFITEELPDVLPDVMDILEERKKRYLNKDKAEKARKLIKIKIKVDGPIGLTHFGDPHVDDDGCDLPRLEEHLNIVRETPGMFGGNIGDLQNNWIGRLGRLYGEQSTSAQESWMLTEWMISQVNWLYLIKGNHDCWTGSGDPVDWMRRYAAGVTEASGARMNLVFPNKKEVRINARHDFHGRSMWNAAHGPAKAAMMGWRDHILTAGHTHQSAYNVLKCPASGLISHALRLASYKVHDRYAKEMGLPDQNISPAVTTVIDPSRADDDPALITVFWDVAEAADFLTWKRKRHERSKD
jgi:hypothetical protein